MNLCTEKSVGSVGDQLSTLFSLVNLKCEKKRDKNTNSDSNRSFYLHSQTGQNGLLNCDVRFFVFWYALMYGISNFLVHSNLKGSA